MVGVGVAGAVPRPSLYAFRSAEPMAEPEVIPFGVSPVASIDGRALVDRVERVGAGRRRPGADDAGRVRRRRLRAEEDGLVERARDRLRHLGTHRLPDREPGVVDEVVRDEGDRRDLLRDQLLGRPLDRRQRLAPARGDELGRGTTLTSGTFIAPSGIGITRPSRRTTDCSVADEMTSRATPVGTNAVSVAIAGTVLSESKASGFRVRISRFPDVGISPGR